MSNDSGGLLENVTSIGAKWAVYAGIVSTVIYLLGYLVLRFQLSTLGVGTDLDLFDEKYLFAGSRFLVYLFASVPSLLLILIVLSVPFFLLSKLLPARIISYLKLQCRAGMDHRWLAPLAVVFGVLSIQFLFRKCFVLGNLLVEKQLPANEWIAKVLRSGSDFQALYFVGLVAVFLLTAGLLFSAVRSAALDTPFRRFSIGMLAFVVAVQFLLLPINYGVLVGSRALARVSEVPGETLKADDQAWLVCETKNTFTFLVRSKDDSRMLVTLPRKDSRVKIVAYDTIFNVLFPAPPPPPQVTRKGI